MKTVKTMINEIVGNHLVHTGSKADNMRFGAGLAIGVLMKRIESDEFMALLNERAHAAEFSKPGETYPVLRNLLRAFFDAALNEGSDDAQG